METTRTFISLNLDEPVKRKFAQVQNSVKEALKEYVVKWENPFKFHLTLRFLGDLNHAEIRDLVNELDKINTGIDNIVFFSEAIGFFPNARYPNVVFIDLREKSDHLNKLLTEIDNTILEFGIKPDKKFVPHVTLGRFRRDKRQLLNTEIKLDVPITEVLFEEFFLMKSVLQQTGSEYEIIKKYILNK